MLREGTDELHDLKNTVDLVGGESGVAERPSGIPAGLSDLRVHFVTATRRVNFTSQRVHAKPTYLLSTTGRLSMRKLISRIETNDE